VATDLILNVCLCFCGVSSSMILCKESARGTLMNEEQRPQSSKSGHRRLEIANHVDPSVGKWDEVVIMIPRTSLDLLRDT
jgi:hypothetical protein